LVIAVDGASDAAEKGLRAGDVIDYADQHAVDSPKDVVASVAVVKKEGLGSILLGVRREGHTLFVPIKIDDK